MAKTIPNANWILATCVLASSLSFIDGSVVNVGLPAIASSLKARADDLPWVINAYLLPLGALLLTGGAAGDRFGRKRLLIIGVTLFGASAQAPEATANTTVPTVSIRRRPYRSPAAPPNSKSALKGSR